MQEALDSLVRKEEVEPEPGVLAFAQKSMWANLGKPIQIPFQWSGAKVAGVLTFTTSNKNICDVTDDGRLMPMKKGTAIIQIFAPNNQWVIFTVTVN